MPNNPHYRNFVYPPPRAITSSLEVFEERSKNQRPIFFGIPAIDKRVNPPVPGDLVVIAGRPGMAKTLRMVYEAKNASRQLHQMGASSKEVVIYATWETMVEEFVGIVSAGHSGYTLSDIGRGKADLKKIRKAAAELLDDRIIVVGRGKANIGDPDLSVLDLEQILIDLLSDGYSVVSVYVDYLQLIPPMYTVRNHNESAKTLYISENLQYLKKLAMRYNTRFSVAVQAGRQVDDRLAKMPGLNDAQWTSAIEQACDKFFGQTIPAKYMEIGKKIVNVGGYNYECKPTTLLIQMFKQRWGVCDSSDFWAVEFNPVLLTISPQEPLEKYVPGVDDEEQELPY